MPTSWVSNSPLLRAAKATICVCHSAWRVHKYWHSDAYNVNAFVLKLRTQKLLKLRLTVLMHIFTAESCKSLVQIFLDVTVAAFLRAREKRHILLLFLIQSCSSIWVCTSTLILLQHRTSIWLNSLHCWYWYQTALSLFVKSVMFFRVNKLPKHSDEETPLSL